MFHLTHKAHGRNGMGMNQEIVVMGPMRANCPPGEALTRGLHYLLGKISLNPEAPLHENSVVGLSLAPLRDRRYSVGVKRTLDMNWCADSDNSGKKAHQLIMLVRLGQLATCQQMLDRQQHGQELPEGCVLGSQIFLLGKPVKHPSTQSYVLQFDVVQVAQARLKSAGDMRCERPAEGITVHPYFCQKLNVVQHTDTKMLAFDAGARPDPESLKGVTPLITPAEVESAFTWRPRGEARDRPPPQEQPQEQPQKQPQEQPQEQPPQESAADSGEEMVL